MLLIILAAFVFALLLSPSFRCGVSRPVSVVCNAAKDAARYFRLKKYNLCKTGDLNIYCGYFGSGKTLSLVHKVVGLYEHYNGLPVWCERRKKWVTQRVLVLSNVTLSIPYISLQSLSQVVAASKTNTAYDDKHDTLTITAVCMDELSLQMNSRSFKENFNAYFLNCLLCCRHYHISFYGSSQRFQHVDKLMRDVTLSVIQCRKFWRFQLNFFYDAWEMENATSPDLIRPLKKVCWFVRDKDYNAYDTLAVVDNLKKKMDDGDILTDAEILANQAPPAPLGMDAVSHPSRKYLNRQRKIKRK